ncbi:ABC transporter ATP-binding protein [Negativibacillus massiliensis]|uniref:ABC transporter ATP-binding protein n=1 Tax=Negativibacillus massiliensis TaxID=1871035 RepID=UPI003AF27D61
MKDAAQALLHIENLKTVISSKDGKLVPVDGVDITIPKGKTVGIVGESGCGKSMTAMSIMGLLPNTTHIEEGKILFQDMDLTKLNPKELRKITGDKISIIFQEPMTSLNPVIQVGKQVREAILLHEKVSKEEAKQRVIEIFRQVGIPEPERRYNAYPHQLSGGLRQRVMIGMAMVCNPDLLIADEPTTALDVTIEAQILHLMRQLQKDKGTSIMMITHNLGVVAEICDQVYVMYAGKVVESAEVHELFQNPKHPYTQGLLGALPKMDSRQRLNSIDGMVPTLKDMPTGCRFAPRCPMATQKCREEQPDLVDVTAGHQVRCFMSCSK